MKRIAAVVVTFNRKHLLINCIKALLLQSSPLDKIIIFDNCSTDGTADMLMYEFGNLGNIIQIVKSLSNIGGAGGFHEGIKIAYDGGYDMIWVMDDDTEPSANCSENIKKYADLPDAMVLAPIVMRANGELDSFAPHRGNFQPARKSTFLAPAKAITEADLSGRDFVEINAFSFVGPCFRRELIESIGLPLKEFFIHYDDTEYALRVRRLGKMYALTQCQIVHNEAAKQNTVTRKYFGLSANTCDLNRLWIQYYGFRNMVWMISRGKVRTFKAMIIVKYLKNIVESCMFGDHKLKRLKFWTYALFDGMTGRFDNDRPKSLIRISGE